MKRYERQSIKWRGGDGHYPLRPILDRVVGVNDNKSPNRSTS